MTAALPSLPALLARAMALAQARQPGPAQDLLDQILRANPAEPDALHLLGLLRRRQGDNETAVDLFRRSLAARPAQPHVQANLGNALDALGRHEEAIAAYRAALALQPDHPDARTNLGLTQIAAGRAQEACETLARPTNGPGWSALGRALREAGRLDEAVAALETAATLRPDHLPTLHALGVTLRLHGRADAAAELLQRAVALHPGAAQTHYVLGHCLHDLGRIAEALDCYAKVVEIDPAFREAHDRLSRLRWQQGQADRWLSNYAEAIARRPDDGGLFADLAAKLNLAGQTTDSIAMLETTIARGIEHPEVHHRLGQALEAGGRTAEAVAALERALRLDPVSDAIALDLARARIAAADWRGAHAALDGVLARAPFDQQALAYRALAWRRAHDPRAAWLDDRNRFVVETMLPPPPGYAGIEAFNARLAAVLAGLHDGVRHPIEQTLRGGTQTAGHLFARAEPEIRALESMLRAAVADYVAALPAEEDHPFLARRGADFRFSGAWSVRLREPGFHLNHVHARGWISSVYYVALPDAVADPAARQGWLTLGQSSLAGDEIGQAIQPRPGLLVLFPSYTYHGTLPFAAGTDRLTVAFDVVPG